MANTRTTGSLGLGGIASKSCLLDRHSGTSNTSGSVCAIVASSQLLGGNHPILLGSTPPQQMAAPSFLAAQL